MREYMTDAMMDMTAFNAEHAGVVSCPFIRCMEKS